MASEPAHNTIVSLFHKRLDTPGLHPAIDYYYYDYDYDKVHSCEDRLQ
jgi:hypothetical protein